MAKNSRGTVEPPHADLRIEEFPSHIESLTRRLRELEQLEFTSYDEAQPKIRTFLTKLHATYDDVYGAGTVECLEAKKLVGTFYPMFAPSSATDRITAFNHGKSRTIAEITARIE